MSSSKPLVLITGGSGFVGTHVTNEALAAGYPVRLTARSSKVQALRDRYAGKVEVVAVDDIATGDYTEALKGVGAILHLAAPLGGKAEHLIDGAVEGSQNILRQAVKNGVKKIVITSSIVAVIDFDKPEVAFSKHIYTVDQWNPATREQALDGTHEGLWNYSAAKTIAEQEIWKFADAHPEIDITTINPPFIYGPVPEGVHISAADIKSYSTLGYFYGNVLAGGKVTTPQSTFPQTVDVRDVARAHVLALSAPSTKEVGRKRLFVAGPTGTWKAAVEHLAAVRPELKGRLPDLSEARDADAATVDVSRAKEVLGLTEYISWEKTVEDTADSLVAIEKADA